MSANRREKKKSKKQSVLCLKLTKYNGGRSDFTGGSLVGPVDIGIGAGFKRLVSNVGGCGRGREVCRK